jgi:hypothetical protein
MTTHVEELLFANVVALNLMIINVESVNFVATSAKESSCAGKIIIGGMVALLSKADT